MPVVAGPPQGHGPSTFDKSEFLEAAGIASWNPSWPTSSGHLGHDDSMPTMDGMTDFLTVKMGALMGSSKSPVACLVLAMADQFSLAVGGIMGFIIG
jgi:hypothetical protein